MSRHARRYCLGFDRAEGLAALEAAPGIDFEVRTGLSGEALHEALAQFDGAILRSGARITAESLEGNTRLKAIVRAGVGTDNIDKTAATRRGIVVMNTPAGNTLSTAELTFALMLDLSRKISPAFESLKQGRWDRKSFMGAQLAGKTLGVIGMGRIGREVAQRAQAFDMRVVAYDPFLTDEMAEQLRIQRFAAVHDLLPEVDYLTVHTPLTAETRDLIRLETLELLKPGARLINCARGGIYNEDALVAGLQSGRLAGVALDVFCEEPCTQHPLFQMEGVLCTPHLGASTEEAQTQVAVEAVQLLADFLNTGAIRHAVNVAALDPKTLTDLRGHLNLAYRLGRFMAQWRPSGMSSCELLYRGEVAQKDTRVLTSAFCAGLLESSLDQAVNIINAEALLAERGVKPAIQLEREQRYFKSSITASITADGQRHTVGGTLFGTTMPRLIRLNQYRLEAYMDGHLLVFQHDDQPGVIGGFGNIMAAHQVNIAQMFVGRSERGGAAIGVLQLDEAAPDAAVQEALRIAGVHSVRRLEMPPADQSPPWLAPGPLLDSHDGLD